LPGDAPRHRKTRTPAAAAAAAAAAVVVVVVVNLAHLIPIIIIKI